MYKNIIFFNHFHNGDIHVSREFVRKLSAVFTNMFPNVNIYYSHRNDSDCVVDIPGVKYNQSLFNWNPHDGPFVKDETLHINTWYGQQQFRYMNNYGVSFDCLYIMFDDVCKQFFNFSLSEIDPNPERWFPKIDFSKYHISEAKKFLDNRKGYKVFVANNNALSGQATNFPMLPMITNLAINHQDITFILTNFDGTLILPNMFYSSNIIGKNGFDLNENGYISTHCDMIIGRASGPYTFAFVQDNLFEKPRINICFSNLTVSKENTFWLSDIFRDKVKYTSKIIVENVSDAPTAFKIVEGNLHG